MIDIGFKNYIDPTRIHLIMPADTARARWFRREAVESRALIDCTQGRKTNSVILLTTNHLILSSLKYKSLQKRIEFTEIENGSEPNINSELLEALSRL